MIMNKNRIRKVILLGSISLIGIIIFQVFWSIRTFNTIDKQFNDKIKTALFEVAKKMSEFNHTQIPNENPVKQLYYNYFVVDLNEHIDPPILEHFLKTEFAHNNIEVDYEYAIYDCYDDKMVYGNYISQDDSEMKSTPRQFQKFDEYLYYFGLRFPGKTAYIFASTNLWLLSGLVLVLAIAFFAYAISELIRQRKLTEIQKDFINNMTHEFKTPISTIGISAQVLSDPDIKEDPERLSNYAGIIYEQNKNLEEKIEKILQSSILERTRNMPEFSVLSLNDVIINTCNSFNVKLAEKKGEFILSLDDSIPEIKADRFHLSNTIFNLIDNAFKYSPENPRISITTKMNDNNILLEVSDNGFGIEEQYQKKIFGKFFRVPSGNIHDVKGFGLGLSYAKNVLRAHRWKIVVESRINEGSKFTIIIPVK